MLFAAAVSTGAESIGTELLSTNLSPQCKFLCLECQKLFQMLCCYVVAKAALLREMLQLKPLKNREHQVIVWSSSLP